MAPLLTALLFSAAPLSVRVLEREQPVTATLEAKAFRCDGAALPGTSLPLKAADRRVLAGGKACDVLDAEGPLAVTLPSVTRRYPGRLTVVNAEERLKLVLALDVEQYLPSVLGAEAGGQPPEALAAQAVVSRTFALASRKRHERFGYDLCDLAHCQVFRGQEDVSADSSAAVSRTANQVLLLGGVALVPTFFHAACGGGTSRASDVFGERSGGGRVSDLVQGKPRCGDSSFHFEAERAELAKALGQPPVGAAFEPLARDTSGRVLQVRAFGKRFTGAELQSKLGRAFGWQSVPAMVVEVKEVEGRVHFDGRGVGHGVGLCQRGGQSMARAGNRFTDILRTYFPDASVKPAP